MTHDLVERLRGYRPQNEWGDGVEHTICNEAADRIEALERENAALRAEKDELRKAVIEEAATLAENATISVQHDWAPGPVKMPIDHRKDIAAAIRNMGDRT
ncbi:hypothetical protein [Shinella granuli]|jgi:SOS-response transcriptional repressor LexA|uniref:Ead/Ea22-like family protein n=1 Tax=Shinella granuli TaxID=323621 RepID=A0A4R2D2N1_SHIGR|nr:hypothetical protein [Shinella granuli]TCN48053.1 hypothetical protein EV665_102582 [Shinella granuli]